MKRLLVPTDFSPCAYKAAQAAMSIAAKMDAIIYFLHIMLEPLDVPHTPNPQRPIQHNPQIGFARDQLNKLVLEAEHRDVKTTQLLIFEKADERIENYIKPYAIDLIVMGSHGATGKRELVIGSNTQRVVRNAVVPVLVIKQPLPAQGFSNIVFASTFTEQLSEPFATVVAFAKYWDAQVHLLFVNLNDRLTSADKANEAMKKLTRDYPDRSFTTSIAEANDEEWAISQFTEQIGADLIALTAHDKAGFIFKHCIAEDLVNHEDTPVLVLKKQ
jgi:nucleotide-binding universal stress UspA family protein